MERKLGHGVLVILLGIQLAVGGCSGNSTPSSPAASAVGGPIRTAAKNVEPAPPPAVGTTKVSDRPPNPNGRVFVVEYHHIRNGKGTMFRTPPEFRSDLERMYKLGFRPVTVSDYLENKMPLPPGASPMVFTFDDSNPSQLQLKPDGSVDPDCAIGMWQAFAAKHPDFPVRATFYVLSGSLWGQKDKEQQKLVLLRKLGCELGNHTITHPILRKLSDDKVKWELGEADIQLEKLGQPLPASLALPFGVSPRNKALLHGFDYKGRHVQPTAVFLVGAEPAPAPTSAKLNRYAIPRIQACEGLSGITYWFDQYERGRVKVYVK